MSIKFSPFSAQASLYQRILKVKALIPVSLILPQMTTGQQTSKRAFAASGADNEPKKVKTNPEDAQEQGNTTSPASGGAAGSGGSNADKSKQATLMNANGEIRNLQ